MNPHAAIRFNSNIAQTFPKLCLRQEPMEVASVYIPTLIGVPLKH